MIITGGDIWLSEINNMVKLLTSQHVTLQVIELVDSGQRLPPPPGCSRIVYELMIKCWFVILS